MRRRSSVASVRLPKLSKARAAVAGSGMEPPMGGGAVLDDDRLLEQFAQSNTEAAGADIDDAAGRRTDHELDGLVGVVRRLRLRLGSACGCERSQRQAKPCEQTAPKASIPSDS